MIVLVVYFHNLNEVPYGEQAIEYFVSALLITFVMMILEALQDS